MERMDTMNKYINLFYGKSLFIDDKGFCYA